MGAGVRLPNMGGDREPDPSPPVGEAGGTPRWPGGTSITGRDRRACSTKPGRRGVTGKPWSPPGVGLPARTAQRRAAGPQQRNRRQGQPGPLVDESTWRAAQSVLNAPGRCTGSQDGAQVPIDWPVEVRPGCGGPLRGRRVYPKGEARGPLSYSCARCHRMSIYAHHVEPLILEVVVDKLSRAPARSTWSKPSVTGPKPRRCACRRTR